MEQINLNVIPDGVMPVCHASQFDKNRTIRFNLKDNGSAYTLAGTETITCKVRKPDDTENTINVANTSSSYVDVTFGLGDTDLSGYAMCELKIVKGTQTIGSRNFLLNIEADAFDGSKLEERSASGAIASFETNYIDNLNELIVNITATQAGSGTPSPSNPRPISGHSSCTITVEDDIDTPQEVKTVTIFLGGTCYGGTLNVTTGVLTITHVMTTVNDAISNRTTSYSNPVFYGSINGLKPQTDNILSECFNVISGKPSASSFASNSSNYDFAINSANTGASIQVFLRCDDYTDVTSLKNALGTKKIVYEFATPTTVQLTPTEVRTLLEDNNIFADTGDVVSCKYLVEVT